MSPSLFIMIVFLAFAGCKAVTWLGATPIDDHNQLSEKVEDLSKKTNLNVANLGGSVVELAKVNVTSAKGEGDTAKLVTAVKTQMKAEIAVEEAETLSKTTLPRTEAPSIDGTGIMGLIGSALGGNWMELITGLVAMLAGGKAYQTQKKLASVKEKARKFATTPETFDISSDKDLA